MKLIYSLVSLFLFITSLNAKPLLPAKDTWKTYTIIESVSCEMPGEPERDTTYKRDGHEISKIIKLEYVSDDIEDKNISYSVILSCSFIPKDTLVDSAKMYVLHNMIKEGLIAEGNRVDYFEIIKVDDSYISRAMIPIEDSKDVMAMQYTFCKKGLIIAFVRTPHKYADNQAVKRFFNSIYAEESDPDENAADPKALSWVPVTGTGGCFEATLPGSFFQDSSAQIDKGAYLKIVKYTCVPESSLDPNISYEIRHVANEIEADSLSSPIFRKRIFDNVVKTTAKEGNAEPHDRKEIQINGVSGCEWGIHKQPEDIAIKFRCFLLKCGMVLGIARSTFEYDSNATMMKFLNSFTFADDKYVPENAGSLAENSWERYFNPEGDFSIDFPCMPARDSTIIPVLSLDVINYIYACAPDGRADQNTMYRCVVFNLSEDLASVDSTYTPKGYVNSVISYLKESPNVDLVKDSETEMYNAGEKYNVREIVLFNKADNITIRGRFYCLRNKVLQLTVAAPAGVQENENMMKFFNSLKILNQ